MPAIPTLPIPATRNALMLGAALLVLGLRLVVIDLCAVPVPYVDEWTAIGLKLLLPWQQGTLDWPALWALHNGEHRIVGPRLLELGFFAVNGQWDPLIGMVVNALTVAAMVALWIGAISPAASNCQPRAAFVLIVALLWALPFGYANLLWSFQSHLFLLLLCTVLDLREASGLAAGGRVRWWVVAIALIAAILCSGGGFVTVIATGAVFGARIATGGLSFRDAAGGLVAVGTAALMGCLLAAGGFGLPSWDALFVTLLKGASWPHSNLVLLLASDTSTARYLPAWLPFASTLSGWFGALGTISGFAMATFGALATVVWAPFFMRLLAAVRRRAPVSPIETFHLGLGGWVLAMLAAIALKRATDYFVPTRYLDLFIPGLVVNGWFALQSDRTWLRRLWFAIVGAGLFVTFAGIALTQLPRRAAESDAWMQHLSGYAQHHEISRLENLAVGQLPNLGTDPAPLVALLDLPGFSEMLVPELRAEPPRHGPLGRASRLLLSASPFIAAAGLLLLWRAGRRRPSA